jgi:hypothetical protein
MMCRDSLHQKSYLAYVWLPSDVLQENICLDASIVWIIALFDVDARVQYWHPALSLALEAAQEGLQSTAALRSTSSCSTNSPFLETFANLDEINCREALLGMLGG